MKILEKIYQAVCKHNSIDVKLISLSSGTGTNAPEHLIKCKDCGANGKYTKVNFPLEKSSEGIFAEQGTFQTRYRTKEIVLTTPLF